MSSRSCGEGSRFALGTDDQVIESAAALLWRGFDFYRQRENKEVPDGLHPFVVMADTKG